MTEVFRKNDMWPDLELHMDRNSDSFRIWITGKESNPHFPYVSSEVQFCTLRWWWISLKTRKALFDLFCCLQPSPHLADCFRRISSWNQTLQLCLEKDDSDMIVEFPSWPLKEEREITLNRDNLSSQENDALDNLYEAMKQDQKDRPV